MEDEEITYRVPGYVDYFYKIYPDLISYCKWLEGVIDIYYYDLSGVKAVDPTREKGSYNKAAADNYYYILSEKIDRAEGELDFCRKAVSLLEDLGKKTKDNNIKYVIENVYMRSDPEQGGVPPSQG